ncbi:MAG: hypothetical protein K2J95_09645 [Lachnospiraceae bacterium]|nr:hypothetical protein [Lachnospiraceae bacterium]
MKKAIDKSKIMVLVPLVLTGITFYYCDINSNIRQGINVWEALFSGQFFHYYSINLKSLENGEMIHPANYDMVMNILMGIWQLPLYILEKILNTNIQNYTLAKIWGELYPIIAIVYSGKILRKIALEISMSNEQAENAVFMFLTGTYALTVAGVIGQADTIGIMFILLAMENLIKDNQRRFLFFFIIAAQCKFFALFIFIPIILLREKNLFKIALQTFAPLLVSFLIDLPFKMIDPLGTASKKTRLHAMLYDMTENRISLMGVDISVIFIVFSVICLFAYLHNKPEKPDLGKWYLYLGLCSILSTLVCYRDYPYWLIYVSPFISILIFLKRENLLRRVLLETIASLSLTVGFLIFFHGSYAVNYLLLQQIYPADIINVEKINSVYDIIMTENYCNAWTLTYGIFIAWAIGFLISYFPDRVENGENELIDKEKNENHETDSKQIHLLLWLRAIGGYVICNISLFIYFALKMKG